MQTAELATSAMVQAICENEEGGSIQIMLHFPCFIEWAGEFFARKYPAKREAELQSLLDAADYTLLTEYLYGWLKSREIRGWCVGKRAWLFDSCTGAGAAPIARADRYALDAAQSRRIIEHLLPDDVRGRLEVIFVGV